MPFCFFFANFKSDYPKWCHFTRDEYVCYKVVFAGVIGPYTTQLKERNTLNPWAIKWAPKQNTTVRTLSCQNSILQDGSALLWFLDFFLKPPGEGGGRHSWEGWSTFPKKFWPNYGNFWNGKGSRIEIDLCNVMFKYPLLKLSKFELPSNNVDSTRVT